MAEMIPEKLPAKSTAGEKRVFSALERLPDDCLVYYEAVIRQRHPDVIAILPEVGVLIIEVKDWFLAELKSVTPQAVTVSRGDKTMRVPHPLRQARDYMMRLRDECRKHPQAGALLQKDGRYAGQFNFPFCHIGVLSNINRSQIEREAPDLMRLFPAGVTVTRDELAGWDTIEPHTLLEKLKVSVDPWWPFPKLTQAQVDILRSVIHPEIIIRASETDLAVLDLRQERNARAIGDGHRIVYGVAGSGKTVLLIARAKLLAEEPGKHVLVLCYNRLLADHLKSSLANHRGVTAMTFHAWGIRSGAQFRKDEDNEIYGQRLLARLQSEESLRGQFDAVLIDEAQDWPCTWFQCAKLALKDPEDGDLLIVGDGSQSLYRKRPFSWADAGIHAKGRAINRKLDLDRNYRNTAEILRVARAFSMKADPDAQSVLALPVEPDAAIRSGPEPWLVQLDDPASETHYAAALIETWLRGGMEIGGRRQRINPGEIAVLYPRKRNDVALEMLRDRLNGFTRAALLTGANQSGRLQDRAVKIMSMHSARGLQFRIVILLWIDLLPSNFKDGDGDIDRGLIYVAATRAEDMLVVLHSGRSPYVDELYRVLGVAPA